MRSVSPPFLASFSAFQGGIGKISRLLTKKPCIDPQEDPNGLPPALSEFQDLPAPSLGYTAWDEHAHATMRILERLLHH